MNKHKHSRATEVIFVRYEVRQQVCPECGAERSEHCIGAKGQKRYASHQERWNLYRKTLREKEKE